MSDYQPGCNGELPVAPAAPSAKDCSVCGLSKDEHDDANTFVAATPPTSKTVTDGELWVFLRYVLTQGGAIEYDSASGRLDSHQKLSIRLDTVSREMVAQFRERFSSAVETSREPQTCTEKDAARYEWLREHWLCIATTAVPMRGGIREVIDLQVSSVLKDLPFDPQTLDHAIDSKLQDERERGEVKTGAPK